MFPISQLYTLQQLDSEIQQGKARLSEILQAQKTPTELIALRDKVEGLTNQLKELENQQRKIDLEVQSVKHEAQQAETRLYSGNVKNPKELGDLQKKIESLGRRRINLEDDILNILINFEEIESIKEQVDDKHQKMETIWEANSQNLQTEQNTLVKHLHQIIKSRKEQAIKTNSDYLKIYESIRKKQRNGIAVAGLQNDRCQVCKVSLSSQLIKVATEGKLSYCESCGRILHPI